MADNVTANGIVINGGITMARARRTGRRTNRTRMVRKTASAPRAPKQTKVPVDVAAIRAELGDFSKEILHQISDTEFFKLVTGTPEQITNNLNAFAKIYELEPGTFTVAKRSFSKGSGYRRYSETRWALIGRRPYTDVELAKEGPKLILQKKKREAAAEEKRQKELAELNVLAAKLGVRVISNKTATVRRKPKAAIARRSKKSDKGSTYRSGDLAATPGTSAPKPVTRKSLVIEAKRLGIKGADRMTLDQLTQGISNRLDKKNINK